MSEKSSTFAPALIERVLLEKKRLIKPLLERWQSGLLRRS